MQRLSGSIPKCALRTTRLCIALVILDLQGNELKHK